MKKMLNVLMLACGFLVLSGSVKAIAWKEACIASVLTTIIVGGPSAYFYLKKQDELKSAGSEIENLKKEVESLNARPTQHLQIRIVQDTDPEVMLARIDNQIRKFLKNSNKVKWVVNRLKRISGLTTEDNASLAKLINDWKVALDASKTEAESL